MSDKFEVHPAKTTGLLKISLDLTHLKLHQAFLYALFSPTKLLTLG